MSDSSQMSWSDNPYAPKIPYPVYLSEKSNFAGVFIGAILYGLIVVLFFQCMGALFDPVNRARGGVRWGLVAHTIAMFSLVTVYTAMTLDIQSLCYVDDQEFPGVGSALPPGPIGYRFLLLSKPINIIADSTFLLNNWLADGLMLYRCYVIYAKNYWVVVFPCLIYLASFAMGIVLIYQTSQPISIWNSLAANIGVPYFSLSVSLNVLLTLMIVIRLLLHNKRFQDAIGPSERAGGLYKAIITILVESSALYAVNSILFIGPWAVKNRVAGMFLPILAETQVIAPFLIILRVANQSALASNTTLGSISSVRARSKGRRGSGSGTIYGGYPMSSMESQGRTTDEFSVAVETTINVHHDKV